MVWVGAGCGCGLDRVWIGLDPGLDRPKSSVQLGRLAGWPYNLQQCQLDSLTAWMCNSCSLAAGLLDCLAA